MSMSWQRDAEGEGPDTYAATLAAERADREAAAGATGASSTAPVLPHTPRVAGPSTGLCGVRSPGGGLLCERDPHPAQPDGHLWRHVVQHHHYDGNVRP